MILNFLEKKKNWFLNFGLEKKIEREEKKIFAWGNSRLFFFSYSEVMHALIYLLESASLSC